MKARAKKRPHNPGPITMEAGVHGYRLVGPCMDEDAVPGERAVLAEGVRAEDARFFSAAPAMLEALREIAAGRLDYEGDEGFHERARTVAKAAVRKARGEEGGG